MTSNPFLLHLMPSPAESGPGVRDRREPVCEAPSGAVPKGPQGGVPLSAAEQQQRLRSLAAVTAQLREANDRLERAMA
jgi:hypothetical protein